jgi:hypothetical protein
MAKVSRRASSGTGAGAPRAAPTSPAPLGSSDGTGARGDAEPVSGLRPAAFCRQLLAATDASEGRRKRRKRDTTPDAIGLAIKRDLLTRAAEADPAPEQFEGWLLEQTFRAPASGPVRALSSEILTEYRFACADPTFRGWLADGAPSADTLSQERAS